MRIGWRNSLIKVSNVIKVAWPGIRYVMGVGRYEITEPQYVPNSHVITSTMYDTETNNRVPMVWSMRDDETLSELDRVTFIKNLLENAANSLTMLIEEQSPSAEETTFDT